MLIICVLFHIRSCFQSEIEKRFGMGRMVSFKGGSDDHKYFSHAIATDSALCSKIGSSMIEKNGSAVDALIASLLCLSVIHPHSSGIGGGGFAMIYNEVNRKSEFVNFRESSPGCGNEKMANNDHHKITEGGLSVAVPGELKGYSYLWKKYGRLKISDLLAPVIKLADHGIVIDESLSIAIEKWKHKIRSDRTLNSIFMRQNRTLKMGGVYRNPLLSQTFRLISKNGFDIFYSNFSSTIEKEVKSKGGCLTDKDIREYEILHQTPLELKFGKHKVLLSPPPTSGAILGLILNIFKVRKFKPSDIYTNPEQVYHFMVETFKFAFSVRERLSDPTFNKNEDQIVKNILSLEFAKTIAKKISTNHTNPILYYGSRSCAGMKTGTTHLVVKDAMNLFASVTSTINGYFGAKFASPKYGFIYNNEMDDFCFPNMVNDYLLPPNRNNYPQPRKRPVSSSVPTFVINTENNSTLAVGGSGGSIITTATAQVIIYYLIFGMSLNAAVSHPRLHSQLTPNKVFFESRFDKQIIARLKRYGHVIDIGDVNHGVVQALASLRGDKTWVHQSAKKQNIHSSQIIYAESDFRKGGQPSGE